MQSAEHPNRVEEAALRGLVWSLVGAVFGFIYVIVFESLEGSLSRLVQIAVSMTGAAAATALLYGSMRLTVLVANFTFIAMLVYVWQGGTPMVLEPMVFIGAGVGLAVGAAYGLKDKASRVFCAEAKIIAGAVAGAFGGALAVLLVYVFRDLAPGIAAIVVAPLAILAYIRLSGWFISRCHRLLPPFIDGAIVGLGVGSLTGLVFLIMAGTLDAALLGSDELRGFVDRVEASWGATVFGCMLACFPVGAVRALLNLPWYNR